MTDKQQDDKKKKGKRRLAIGISLVMFAVSVGVAMFNREIGTGIAIGTAIALGLTLVSKND